MVAQSMAKNREYRFADARAMRRALLAATESNLPAGRRSAYSIPPTAADLPVNVQAKVQAVSRPPNRAPDAPSAHSATWGDFEGLTGRPSGRVRAIESVPATSPQAPAAPAQARAPVHGGLELAVAEPQRAAGPASLREPATPRDRATPDRAPPDRAPGPAKRKQSATRVAEASPEDALDPLYAGATDTAIDLDYGHAPRRARKPAPLQSARGNTGMRVPRTADPEPSAWRWVPWLLAVAVLVLVGYMVQPKFAPALSDPKAAADGVSGTSSSSASVADTAGSAGAGQTPGQQIPKARRPNPGNAPVHMRDVVF